MPNSPAIFEDLIVVSALVCFVSEEMDGRVINTT